MAVSELSLDAIHEYILGKGGKVANRELVHHFKKYLINADKNEARIRFKEYVNKIACSKTENGEKFILLRTKYANALVSPASTPVSSPLNTVGIPSNLQDVSPVPSPSKVRHPPPYRPPPPVSSPSPSIDNISLCSSSMSIKDTEEPPQAPPRRKSQSSRTLSVEVDEAPLQQQEQQQQQSEPIAVPQAVENSEQAISVKERTQKFNRLASVENDLSPQPPQSQKERRRQPETGADEDDGASVTSLDNKRTEWVVAAARGDYQALAKLATANPRLVKTKEPFSYTALHWAAKHGNSDIIKLIAGTYSADVNARTNGGYTALHIAMQFGRKEISELLIDVYHAQRDIRDWSGRTAEYYSTTRRNTSKSDNYHKMKIMKKSSEKDLGFLRIGSLNVRVKKTTEAFSNFLGVGGSSGSITPIDHVLEKVHKSWGSADNVSKDNEMAAPKLLPHNKRKLKYTQEQTTSYSTPGTPNQKRALPTHHHNPDSDSDTACGFDSNWKH